MLLLNASIGIAQRVTESGTAVVVHDKGLAVGLIESTVPTVVVVATGNRPTRSKTAHTILGLSEVDIIQIRRSSDLFLNTRVISVVGQRRTLGEGGKEKKREG